MYSSLLQCFVIAVRSDMGLYDVPMSIYLLVFGIGMMSVNFHVCGMVLLFREYVVHVGGVCESKWSEVFKVLDDNFIRRCGVIVFAVVYCLLNISCSECYCGCL